MNTRFARLSGAGPRLGNGAGNGPGSRAPQKRLGAAVGTRSSGRSQRPVRTEPRIEAMEAWRLRWSHRHTGMLPWVLSAQRTVQPGTRQESRVRPQESAKRTAHHPQPSDPSESLQGHAGCLLCRARDRPERDCESAIGTNGDPGRLDRVGTVGLRWASNARNGRKTRKTQEYQEHPDPLGRD